MNKRKDLSCVHPGDSPKGVEAQGSGWTGELLYHFTKGPCIVDNWKGKGMGEFGLLEGGRLWEGE